LPSIDTLIATIRTSLEQARQLIAGLGRTQEQATEVRDQLGALGIEGRSLQAGGSVDKIEEGQAQANALADRLEAALAAVEAARAGVGGGSSGSGGGSAPVGRPPAIPETGEVLNYPHDRPHPISWSDLIHVCHGDENDIRKGGHLAGTGRPGKKEFPPGWDDGDVRTALTAVASAPDTIASVRRGKFKAHGEYRGVEIDVIVRRDGSIEAGWPTSGPGVRTNPE
jgi:hypothetical protein